MPCVSVTVEEIPQPVFYVANITTDKTSYYTDETITITARIGNSGDADGYASISLIVDGSVVKTDEIYIIAGYTETVSYSVGPLSAGSHTICVEIT